MKLLYSSTPPPLGAYLMVYHKDADHGLHMAISYDGYRTTEWERDGRKYGWGNNRGLVLMKSTDLKHWTRTNLNFQAMGGKWAEVGCVWAPETCYDEEKGKLFLHFTTRFGNGRNMIYYVYMNDDFTQMEGEPKLLFEAPEGKYNVIDSDIMYHDGASAKTPGW